MKVLKDERRIFEQLRSHYEVEKELANKLLNANKEDRKKLYTSVYNELFKRVPNHPQIFKKNSFVESSEAVNQQMKLLKRFLNPSVTFLEVGSGSCNLSIEAARYVQKVYAIDVSDEIAKDLDSRDNFKFLVSDGCSIPVPDNSINVAYSYQLIEHLHPDDTYDQLQNIYKALVYKGVYICVTPNKLSGPHDISRYFDNFATGFHLREYTAVELYDLFIKCGFSKINYYVGIKGRYFVFPFFLLNFLEKIINAFPPSLRRRIIGVQPLKKLLDVLIIVGFKGTRLPTTPNLL